ncbi:MAG: hypothetical protein IJM15_06220 [Erysipelotrichaceae bacterium]|nr:hypothetical protein [Erysipelotrichaceae bacterium]
MKNRLFKIMTLVLAVCIIIGLTACKPISSDTPAEDSPKEEVKTGKKIYFAAPLFSEGEREYNLKLVEILESYGYEVFLPQRDGFSCT